MGYVITNGKYYVTVSQTGKVLKTESIDDATIYDNTQEAKETMKRAEAKTKKYVILDLETKQKYFYKQSRKRLLYPHEVRELIYKNADGKCQLCGRKICYNTMTLDHIKPLSMGGSDSVDNLQCTCKTCNNFKGNILPENFMEGIVRIFMYQMEKKSGNSFRWKIVHRLLENMI